MVRVFSSSRYHIDKKGIQKFAESYVHKIKNIDLNINIIFVGKRKMRSVASEYKHEDVALPVLSFPINDDSLLGEILICFPHVVLLAAEREKTTETMFELMVEHGINNLLQLP